MATQSLPIPRRLPIAGRYFETSLYLLLLVSVLTLVSTGKLDLPAIVLAPLALLVKGYRWWHGRPPELSQRAATTLVVMYFLFFPFDLWWVSRLLAAGAQNPGLYSALLAAVHLMLFAMVVRLFSARTTRDYLFLAMLAFSSMLASAILTVDTAFLAFFLIFLALCVSTFIGLEMRRSAEGATSPPPEPGSSQSRSLQTALGITSGAIAIGALVAGTGIFFLLPRFNAGYLSGFNLQPSLISGFSDDVELGQIGEMKLSNELVMRVKIEGGPAAGDVHWRGIVLTTFDGRRWHSESHEPIAISAQPDGWIPLSAETPAHAAISVPLRYTMFLEPIATDAIFVAAEPKEIHGDFMGQETQGGRGSRGAFVTHDKTGSIANPFHNFTRVRYEAVSDVPRLTAAAAASLRQAGETYPDDLSATYLQLPELDARIPALAKQITARGRNPYDKARLMEQYLRQHYGYTLDLSGSPRPDPLAYFLFEKRAGHCEYFAAAMTVMLRSVGIPARYVNGFLPGEYNSLGGDYIVRARDAHSWVEVYFPGYGWLTFDPTPPGGAPAGGLMSRMALYWDWFQLQWGEWIINYDFFHQYTLLQGMHEASRNMTEQAKNKFDHAREAGAARVKAWAARIAAAPLWCFFLLGGVAAIAFIFSSAAVRVRFFNALKDRWLLGWKLRTHHGPLPPHAAAVFYRRMLQLLEQRGWQKSEAQTPLEFAASLPAGEIAAPVATLTELYLVARFGASGGEKTADAQGAHATDAQKFTALLADVQAALRVRPA